MLENHPVLIRALEWPEMTSALPAQSLLLTALVSMVWSCSSCALTSGTTPPKAGGFISPGARAIWTPPRSDSGGSPWCVGMKVGVEEPCLVLQLYSDFCLSFSLLELSPMSFPPEAAPKEVVSHRDTSRKSHCAKERSYLASFTW